jgi:folate-dependent phosphoribosylglycinamide formyltransferase PurN
VTVDRPLFDALRERCAAGARATILMSGRGSNALVLLSSQHRYPTLPIVSLFADRPGSTVSALGARFGLPVFEPPRRLAAGDLWPRLRDWLAGTGTDVVLCGGFMRILPDDICHRWPGVNVHPADLTVLDAAGRRLLTGMDAVPESLAAGHREVRASAHLVRNPVDEGLVLAVSRPVEVLPGDDATAVHDRLRLRREHRLYPRLLELLACDGLRYDDLPLRDLE